MAWACSMKPKIVVMTRKKDSATTDGMSSLRAEREVTTAIVSLACQFQF
jgi:hypothetical protein